MVKKCMVFVFSAFIVFQGCNDKPTKSNTNENSRDTLLMSVSGSENISTCFDSTLPYFGFGDLPEEAVSYIKNIGMDTVIIFDDTLLWSEKRDSGHSFFNAYLISNKNDSVFLDNFGSYVDGNFVPWQPAWKNHRIVSGASRLTVKDNRVVFGSKTSFKAYCYYFEIINYNPPDSARLSSGLFRFGSILMDSLTDSLSDHNDSVIIWNYKLNYN